MDKIAINSKVAYRFKLHHSLTVRSFAIGNINILPWDDDATPNTLTKFSSGPFVAMLTDERAKTKRLTITCYRWKELMLPLTKILKTEKQLPKKK